MADVAITDLAAAAALTGDELVEVSQLSTSVTITAATISAQASDNSFNDSGAGFLAAGFAVNDRVNVSGFTGNTANNIFVGVITALTASKMTIGGTDGDVIVDDAAGESVTITKWVSRRMVIRIPYMVQRFYQSDQTPPTTTTLAVNSSASFVAFNIVAQEIDLSVFPATHFRILIRAGSTEAGQTIAVRLSQSQNGTPAHTGSTGDIAAVTNTQGLWDSGWITRDDGATGLQSYFVEFKGTNGTVDISVGRIEVHWKITT